MEQSLRTFPKIVLILALVIISLFVNAQPVSAVSIPCPDWFSLICVGVDAIPGVSTSDPVGKAITGALTGIAGAIVKLSSALLIAIIGIIGSVFFLIAGELVKASLALNFEILNTESIRNGYSVTLGVANMGFIIALVVIAFGTMFRSDAFGYKKALPKLIIAALLINFGFFIVTKWLIAPVNQVTAAINSAADFNVVSFKKTFEIEGALLGSFGELSFTEATKNVSEMGKAIATTLFVAIFIFIGTIALLAFAVMLAIRAIALVLLVVLLPLAWAGLVFPNLKIPGGANPWKAWWEQFTRWLLFAPFAMFFFWLAVSLPQPANNESFISASTQMILVAGLLLGGLYVSNRMGITGAAVALGAVTAGKVWAQGRVKALGGGIAHRAFKRTTEDEEKVRPWMQKALDLGKKTKGWKGVFARPAGAPIRALARRTVQTTDTLEEARKKASVAKARAEAPYRQKSMLRGLSKFDIGAGTEDLLDRGYAWEEDEFWPFVTEAGLNPSMLFKLGHQRLAIKLGDAGFRPEAVAAVKPLADFEMPIRDRIEKEMKGKPKEEIEKAIQEEFDQPENAAKIQELQAGIEWTKRDEMKKMMNILKTSDIPKMEKRIWSGHNGWYGNRSKLSHEAYSGNLRALISMDRPQGMSGARNNSRGDGVVNWDITAEEGIKRENEYLIKTKIRVERVTRADAEREIGTMSPQNKIRYIEANSTGVATTIKAEQMAMAEKLIEAAIDIKTGAPLSAEAKAKLREAEKARIDAMTDIDVAALASSRIQGLHRVRRGGLLLSSLIAEES